MALDLAMLEKVKHHASRKVTARCPACAETGADRTGNHLAIFADGRFACVAHGGDADHRRRIHALAGIREHLPPDFARQQEWRARNARSDQQRFTTGRMAGSAQRRRRELIGRHAWHPEDVWDDSPQRIDSELVARDPGHFLASLFQPEDLLWTGEVHHSGDATHAAHWRSCAEWREGTGGDIGPMTTPALWQAGTHSRSAGQVREAPYTVLDFDGLDGIKPSTKEELRRHVADSLALIRWLREAMDWQLAAILWTGGKSLHAWFHTPPPAVLQSLHAVAQPLGMDAGLIGRPEHPCRLPGQVHQRSGERSRVMWLKS